MSAGFASNSEARKRRAEDAAEKARKRLEDELAAATGQPIALPDTADRETRHDVWHEAAEMTRKAAHAVGYDRAEERRHLVDLADHFDERAAAELAGHHIEGAAS